jgi:ribosomal protein S18 acetylase RimI-like enzyme
VIRDAVVEDADRIIELWLQMMRFHVERNEIYALDFDAENIYKNYLLDNMKNPEKKIIVYQSEKGIEGFLAAEVTDIPPVYLNSRIGVINEIAVEEKSRRSGVGENLLTHAEEWFSSNDIWRIECQVSVSNEVSQRFWEKQGYAPYNKLCVKII